MRKLVLLFIAIAIMTSMVFLSCKQNVNSSDNTVTEVPLDSTLIAPFLKSYPDLKKYEKELIDIYQSYNYNYIWFDQKGIAEYGNSLFIKVEGIKDEGVSSTFPYQANIDEIFKSDIRNGYQLPDAEFLLTSLYLFYVDEVYKGIDPKTTKNIGWLLPRKKLNYTDLLDSIISDQQLQHEDTVILFSQYYKLRDALKRYRNIENNGGWSPIEFDENLKSYKPNDTSIVFQQIKERLFKTGEIKENNQSNVFDAELLYAVKAFQLNNGFKVDSLILPHHIEAMNVSVGEYIKKIVVNMERCRWISPEEFRAEKFIFVNIPSYNMNLIHNGNVEFDSPVVVGESMTKTVIFDGMMSYIVFSPYWNLPESIIKKEVLPGMKKNNNYLKSHNMEWNNGKIRQLPGKNNSLGLVKFMFPNSNDIYLHDTPAKSLFQKDNRAMSHGCVRVGKARELAITILKDDEDWTIQKIDSAMHAGEESICSLKTKIPVHIGYFTAWVDDRGEINFFKDIYERDERLATLLYYKD